MEWRPVTPGVEVSLGDGLSYRAFDVPTTKRARFGDRHRRGGPGGGLPAHRRAQRTGRGVPAGRAAAHAGGARGAGGLRGLLIDGTCWHDDELIRLGLAAKTSAAMGHLPIGGPDGSLEQLRGAAASSGRIYVHINNTNPVLLEDSPERRMVDERGMGSGRGRSRGEGVMTSVLTDEFVEALRAQSQAYHDQHPFHSG